MDQPGQKIAVAVGQFLAFSDFNLYPALVLSRGLTLDRQQLKAVQLCQSFG